MSQRVLLQLLQFNPCNPCTVSENYGHSPSRYLEVTLTAPGNSGGLIRLVLLSTCCWRPIILATAASVKSMSEKRSFYTHLAGLKHCPSAFPEDHNRTLLPQC